jgi:hypothetical protein
MVAKDGVIYLQAGGGIVHDSVEEDEYIETINKLKANVTCIESAEGSPLFHFLLVSSLPLLHLLINLSFHLNRLSL